MKRNTLNKVAWSRILWNNEDFDEHNEDIETEAEYYIGNEYSVSEE